MVSNFGLDFAISCLHFALFFIFLRVARLWYRLDALDFESTYVIYDCGAIWLFPGVVMAIYCRYSAKCIEFWANFAKFPHCMANINQSSPLKSFNPTGLRRIYIFLYLFMYCLAPGKYSANTADWLSCPINLKVGPNFWRGGGAIT